MRKSLFLILGFILPIISSFGQNITTAIIEGKVNSVENHPIGNANITAKHMPSGIVYGISTRKDGRFTLIGLRPGGPYSITVSHISFKSYQIKNIYVNLGENTLQDIKLQESSITIGDDIIVRNNNEHQTNGASTLINKNQIDKMPTISRSFSDYLRLSPQIKNNSTIGHSNNLNNTTIDGSSYNNSFGLVSQPGGITGIAPISIDILEQIQVNIASYDVRQADFVGAEINMVTKSGTNELKGMLHYHTRNQNFVGKHAADADYNPGTFQFFNGGGYISGPIIKNKLFFAIALDAETKTEPATSFVANDGTQEVSGNVTRVLREDLEELSSFLKTNFDYDTKGFENYDFNTQGLRFFTKIDYNINTNNNLSFRYNQFNSQADHLIANYNFLGAGFRQGTVTALNFQNSNYAINENISSLVGEWNCKLNNTMSNNFIVSFNYHNESRETPDDLFPCVDILKDGTTYTTFGTEPFSTYHLLKYSTLHLQDNFSWIINNHNLLVGLNIERFHSQNRFMPGALGVYVYNSLDDFYADANEYLANPERTTSSINLKQYQIHYSNIQGTEAPTDELKCFYNAIYAQDIWDIGHNFRLTMGLRIEVPIFGNTAYENTEVENMVFNDENGNDVQYKTQDLPNANPLFSPRIGFKWYVNDNRSTLISGGSGIFTGKPAYVWVANQVAGSGVSSGYEMMFGSETYPLNSRPFNPDVTAYIPENVSGEPASYYEIALTDPGFKFPQIWRSNIAIKQKLPLGIDGSAEFIYDKDVNGISFVNVNLTEPDGQFNGVDNRPYWSTSTKINQNIADAIVMKNDNKGYAWNTSISLEKNTKNGLYAKLAYSYGVAKNTVNPVSVAYGSWAYNAHSSNPNKPDLSYSMYSPGHRFFSAFAYQHNIFKFGTTSISLFLETTSTGRSSYVYAGDLNGDGGPSNDLIYIPTDISEMNFMEYTSYGTSYTIEEQQNAWDSYINKDKYLKSRRGKYAERFGVELPYVTRMDVAISQDVKAKMFGKENKFIIRVDILNFTNLLNKDWGVGQTLLTNMPLIAAGIDNEGKTLHQLQSFGNKLLDEPLTTSASLNDVYQMQLSLKWLFNQ